MRLTQEKCERGIITLTGLLNSATKKAVNEVRQLFY